MRLSFWSLKVHLTSFCLLGVCALSLSLAVQAVIPPLQAWCLYQEPGLSEIPSTPYRTLTTIRPSICSPVLTAPPPSWGWDFLLCLNFGPSHPSCILQAQRSP